MMTAATTSPTHDPPTATTSTTSAPTSTLALSRPRAASAVHSLSSLAASDGLHQQQQQQHAVAPSSPAKHSVHRASSSSITTNSLSTSANRSALPRHGSQLLNTSLPTAQLRKSASTLALAFASDFAAASATPAAHQRLRARSRANLALSPAASTLELDRILTAVESQLQTAGKATTIKLADPIASTSPTLRIAPPPPLPSDPRALPRTASFLLQVTLGEARFPPFQVAPAADARRGTTVGGTGPVGKKGISIAAAVPSPGLGAPKLLRPPAMPLFSTTTLGSADVSPTDPGSTRRPSISFAGLSPLADSPPTSPTILRFRDSGSTASGVGGSSTLVSPMTPLGFLPHGPGPHAHLITFRHKDSSSSIASRTAALTLKDEIYKLLPHPVPRSFYKFFMSQECDLFLKHGVQYLDLYLRHKKAQLAAESKVGLDQLKRLYMAQLASLPDTDAPAPPPDPCDPAASLNDSAAMRSMTPTTTETPTTAPADMDVHALALSQEARESLKADRDAAMHKMCQGYARIVQRYGAAMNFAVERSFYECFYSMLGDHFRAHVPTPEWPAVRTHLESIFQAHFPASRAPAPGSAPPNRARTSVSAAASAAAAALGPSPTTARSASRAAPSEERRASLATDAQGHRVLRAHSTAATGGGAAAVAMALDGLGASMAHLATAVATPTAAMTVGLPVASAVPAGSGKPKVRAQHEVMDVIERAVERKRVEDGKQREREARRKLEAAHSARDTFSLRSVIHARSPLLAQAMPTARDQTHRVLEQSKEIMQAATQARVDLSQRQRTRRGRGRPAPELGTSVDLVEDPPAVRRHALVAERNRAGRSPSRAAARIASASASAAAAAADVVVAVAEPVVPSPPSRRAT
ncbi:hypothetical protein GGF32_007326, partial [Allomyces javanicus]